MDSLTLLPKEEWSLQQYEDVIAAGIYRNRAGYRHSVKFKRSDLPNDLIGTDDLERVVIFPVEIATI
ncbi:hypothetical protein [Mesorhizobium australicum]|uniref:hypothetical protein n=1 Tax=Mesorhizobium australicum TaxID=536018 RepID=UPI0033375A34